jgi:hypothetical protein
MREVEPFPSGVVGLPSRLPGVGFFPGGAGLWGVQSDGALPPMPIGGIMVLGHDFHSEVAFARSVAHGGEIQMPRGKPGYRHVPTWAALLKLLSDAHIAPEQCFFTNAYMGLRAGAGTVGRFPGARDADFVRRCQAFFLLQLHAQRPRVILALGAWVPAFLASLAEELSDWSRVRSLIALDKIGPVRHSVRFASTLPACSVVALTHPSLREANVGRRVYGGALGHAAELAMIRKAAVASGLISV